jgi:hypothetical protein
MRDADPFIRRLERDALIWSGVATVAALAIRPGQPSLAAGVAGGGALAFASLWAIRSSVDALLARLAPAAVPADGDADGPADGDRGQARAGAGLALKLAGRYALLGLLAYVMIARLRLHPIGVLIGASSLVAAASFEAVRVLRRS